jgi:hypothetical protein
MYPPTSVDMKKRTDETGRTLMKVVKRIAIALGSLLAVMLAGGAHFKI